MDKRDDNNFDQPPVFSAQDLPPSLLPKVQPLIDLLNSPEIDLRQLKKLLAAGVPDQASLIRQYAWKVVLGYLPRERRRWQSQTKKHQELYSQFVRQFLHPGKYKDCPIYLDRHSPQKHQALFEHDHRLWEQIEKDTCRTQSELSFFSGLTEPFPIPFYTSTRREKHKLICGECNPGRSLSPQQLCTTYRYDYMTRILFIFARLNPKVEYVQGMNEILAPIFYVVNHNRGRVQEAACFYMFNALMTDILELHMRDFAKKENGVHERMRHITTVLLVLLPLIQVVQPSTWYRLEMLRIDPFYYCFRWITLLFSQEFQLFDTLRLWQSILSAEDRIRYTNAFALALIVASKDCIAVGDYGEILAYLKSVSEHVKLEETIVQANRYYQKFDMKEAVIIAEKNRKKLEKEHYGSSTNRLVKFFKSIF